jgi:hypothetical protein
MVQRYINRSPGTVSRKAVSEFPAVVLTGSRQSGKTTLLPRPVALCQGTHRRPSAPRRAVCPHGLPEPPAHCKGYRVAGRAGGHASSAALVAARCRRNARSLAAVGAWKIPSYKVQGFAHKYLERFSAWLLPRTGPNPRPDIHLWHAGSRPALRYTFALPENPPSEPC